MKIGFFVFFYHAVILTNGTQHAGADGFVTRWPFTLDIMTLLALLEIKKSSKSQKLAQNVYLCPTVTNGYVCSYIVCLGGWTRGLCGCCRGSGCCCSYWRHVIKQSIFKCDHISEIIRQSLRLPVVLSELVKASRVSLRQPVLLQHFQEQLPRVEFPQDTPHEALHLTE